MRTITINKHGFTKRRVSTTTQTISRMDGTTLRISPCGYPKLLRDETNQNRYRNEAEMWPDLQDAYQAPSRENTFKGTVSFERHTGPIVDANAANISKLDREIFTSYLEHPKANSYQVDKDKGTMTFKNESLDKVLTAKGDDQSNDGVSGNSSTALIMNRMHYQVATFRTGSKRRTAWDQWLRPVMKAWEAEQARIKRLSGAPSATYLKALERQANGLSLTAAHRAAIATADRKIKVQETGGNPYRT